MAQLTLDIETLNGALANWDTRMMTRDEYGEYLAAMDEVRAERDAESAYERHMDYQAWLRDGWQPDHAF